MKREDVLTWDEYFMGLAHLSAKRSKDPSTQVGAVIVSDEHRVVSIGYNGFPNGCSDDEFPWDREGEFGNTKYPYVVHAELNAILNSKHDLKGCSRIVYESDKYGHTEGTIASKRMLRSAGVELVQLPYAIELEVTRKVNPTVR